MKSKSKAKKTSSRITKKKGIKSGGKKNKMKVKRNLNVDTKCATRTTRQQKTLRSRQNPERRKTALKKEIVVKRSSGRVEKFDTDRLAQTVSRSGVPFLMARDIAKKATKKIKSQITSPVREDNHMNKKRERELYPEHKN